MVGNHLYVQGYHESMSTCKEMGINYIWIEKGV
jgi:hypothetical protein